MLDTAMILAAGRGERMRPLTDHLPKPLLEVAGKPLIVWHLEHLAAAGFRKVMINHAWLGEKIEQALGDGSRWGLDIAYSREAEALETAGGIATALPRLGDRPFLVISADIFCRFPLSRAHTLGEQLSPSGTAGHALQAWCVMVPNAAHHPKGDFAVETGRLVLPDEQQGRAGLTFSGIALYHPDFFKALSPGKKMALRPLLEQGIAQGIIGAEIFQGQWHDIGTPERLEQINRIVSTGSHPN